MSITQGAITATHAKEALFNSAFCAEQNGLLGCVVIPDKTLRMMSCQLVQLAQSVCDMFKLFEDLAVEHSGEEMPSNFQGLALAGRAVATQLMAYAEEIADISEADAVGKVQRR